MDCEMRVRCEAVLPEFEIPWIHDAKGFNERIQSFARLVRRSMPIAEMLRGRVTQGIKRIFTISTDDCTAISIQEEAQGTSLRFWSSAQEQSISDIAFCALAEVPDISTRLHSGEDRLPRVGARNGTYQGTRWFLKA